MTVSLKESARRIRKQRVRRKMVGAPERPRLSVFRSSRFIYAQIIDDQSSKTLVACSSVEKAFRSQGKSKNSCEAAEKVGHELARRAREKKIEAVVFDRNGYFYHGRVRALADAARAEGLKF